jgi:ketosteroid isomerase-like protein
MMGGRGFGSNRAQRTAALFLCDASVPPTEASGVSERESDLLALLEEHTQAWNGHDLDALMSLFAEDCVFEASGGDEICGARYENEAEVRTAFAEVFEAMPDAEWAGGRHYALAPDYGVSEWTLIGTLIDGRRLEVNGCDFLTVRRGKIIKKNSYRKQRPPLEVSACRP